MTIEQEKEQAKLCVAWLATHNMHRAEENRCDRDPDGKCWVEDDEWENAVEEAKEEVLEDGAYLLNPAKETMDYVQSLKAEDLWKLFEQVTTTKDNLSFVLIDWQKVAKEHEEALKRDVEYEKWLDARDMNSEYEQDEPKED